MRNSNGPRTVAPPLSPAAIWEIVAAEGLAQIADELKALEAALSTVVLDRPAPRIVTVSSIWIVAATGIVPAGSTIVSAPAVPATHASTAALVFAAWTASRSEQSPSALSSSTSVVTVIVAAMAGAAAISVERSSDPSVALIRRRSMGGSPGAKRTWATSTRACRATPGQPATAESREAAGGDPAPLPVDAGTGGRRRGSDSGLRLA